jgi:hypothetical protein
MTQYYYQMASAVVSFGAALFWGLSTVVRLEPWKVPEHGSRVTELVVNGMNPKQWYGALKRQSVLNAIAAGLSAVAAAMLGLQTIIWPPT